VATDAFGIEIARVYGSSEAPNFSGSVPTDERERRLSDDGVLMPGNEVRVGSTGHAQEGMLRGPCVFLGYVDPDDQADAFEDGWFRTGDLVDLNDGRLTVVGRLKAVANRSGLKISLDEIEAALADMDGIREHACVAFLDADTGERLAVAVRPEPGTDVTLERVVTHLLDRGVARRKLPEEVVVWDGPLPRTTSGKIVRSRVVMESAGKPSLVAERLRDSLPDAPTSSV
jgi:acyl-CoA synthetase (AMP-forming)/AMP-acid ligase II